MRRASLTLQPCIGLRIERTHEGRVVALASNQRWASDGLTIRCCNGDIVHVAFTIDTHDREIISWVASAGQGTSGKSVARHDTGLRQAPRQTPSARPLRAVAD